MVKFFAKFIIPQEALRAIYYYGSAFFSVKPEHELNRHSVNALAAHTPKNDDCTGICQVKVA
jgi:hypothetical protein